MTNGTVTNTPQHSDGEESINVNTSSKIYFEITQDDDDDDDDDVILRDVDSNHMRSSMPKKSASKQRSNADDGGDQQQQEEGRDHIKRPLNAFMIWAQKKRKIIMGRRPKMHNAEISRLLGAQWRNLPQTEKDVYRDQAVNLKDLHRVAYPNYKFRPRKRNRKRRRSGAKTTEASPSKSQRSGDDTTKSTMDNQENSAATTCFTHEIELIRDRVAAVSPPTPQPAKVLRDHPGNKQQPPPAQGAPTAANLIYVPVHPHPTPASSDNNATADICGYQQQRNSAAKLFLVPIQSKLSQFLKSSTPANTSSCQRSSTYHHQMKTVYITTGRPPPQSSSEKPPRPASVNKVVVTSSSSSSSLTRHRHLDDVIMYGEDMEAPPALVRPFTEDFLPLQALFSLEACNMEDACMDGMEGCKGTMDVDWAYVDMEAFIEESCTLLRFFENLGQSSRRRKIKSASS